MPDAPDDPFAAAMQVPATAPPPSSDDPFQVAMDPLKHLTPKVLEQAGRDRWTWDRLSSGLQEIGADPEQFKQLKPSLDLEAARRAAKLRGESTSQVFRRKFMPLGDVVGTNWLPDVPDALNPTVAGVKQFGGRVVGNQEYADAVKRFQEGKHSPEDVEKIAQYEAAQSTDTAMKHAPYWMKLAGALGGLGKIGGEMAIGSGVMNLGAKGILAARGGAPLAAAAAGAAPAVPAAPSLLLRGADALATKSAQTALAPSMWVPLMQQRNAQEGRDPNDLKGLPTAFGYGVANMAVLGRLQKGLTSGTTIQAFGKGVLGMTELQGVDAAAGVLDEFLPQAFAVHGKDERYGTVGQWARAYNRGDRPGAVDALEEASIQALSFAAFARLHGKEVEAPKTLLEGYADAVAKLRQKGLDKTEAGKQVAELHTKLEDALQSEPYLTREQARDRLQQFVESSGRKAELADYADKLADTFPPKSRVEKPVEPAPERPGEAAVKAAEKAAEPPPEKPQKAAPNPEPGEKPTDYFNRLLAEGVARGPARVTTRAHYPDFEPPGPPPPAPPEAKQPVAAAATPEQQKYALFGEQLAKLQNEGKTEDEAKAVVRQMFPKFFAEAPQAAAAARAPENAAAEGPRAVAQKLEGQWRQGNEQVAELKRQLALATQQASMGGHPGKAIELKAKLSSLNYQQSKLTQQLQAARDAAFKAEAGSRPAAAASPPEAPGVPPEAAKIQPPPTTSEGPIAPPASTGASRRARMEAIRQAAETGTVSEPSTSPPPPVPAATAKPPHDYAVVNLARSALDRDLSAGAISAKQHAEYAKSFEATVDAMPEAAKAELSKNVRNVRFYATPHEAAKGNAREWIDHPDADPAAREKWSKRLAELESLDGYAVGAFNPLSGTMHVDGQAASSLRGGERYPAAVASGKGALLPREFIYAHEFGHAIDGASVAPGGGVKFKTSSTPEWRSIFISEFSNTVAAKRVGQPPLSEYAGTTGGEAFAEFTRILYSGEIPTSQIARDFPKAAAFFKARGLWPAERGPAEPPAAHVSAPEVFVEKVGPDVGHVDVAASEKKPDGSIPTGGGPAKEKAEPRPATLEEPPRPEPAAAAAPEKRIESAMKAAFGDGVKETSQDPATKQYEVTAGGNRLVNVVWDGEKAQIDFFTPGNASYEVFRREFQVRQGSVQLARGLKKLVDGLHEAGVPVTYTAEKKRAAAYSRALEAAGYKLEKSDVDVDGDRTDVWRPQAKEAPAPEPAPAASATQPRAGGRPAFTPPNPPAARPGAGSAIRRKLAEEPLTEEEQRIEAAKAEARKAPTAAELDAEKLGVGTVKRPDLSTVHGLGEWVANHPALSEVERSYLLNRVMGQTTVDAAKQFDVTKQAVEQASQKAVEKLGFKDFDDLMSGVRGSSRVGVLQAGGEERTAEGVRIATDVKALFSQGLNNMGEMTAAGKPVPVSLFDRIFGRAGESAGGARDWLRRLFFGDLPSSVRAAKEQELDARIAAHAFDVANTEKDLRAALRAEGKGYDKLSKGELAGLDELLRVPHTETLAAAARAGVSERVADVIRGMRVQIDKLSDDLIAVGAVDGPLAGAVAENIGSYLTRQYEVFTNPEWYKKVDQSVVNYFKSWLYGEYVKAYGEEPDMAEIEAKTKSLLVNGTAAENPINFLSKSRLGSKDLSILKERKEIPPELRALWGEFKDPLVNYSNSVGKMANLVANHSFLTRVAREGFGHLFFESAEKAGAAFPESRGAVMFAAEGGETMSPLNGLWTTPEVKRAFDEVFKSPELPAYLSAYMKALSLAKFSKVIVSHTGQMRNFLSNVGIAIRNGYWRVGHLPQTFKDVFSDSPAARQQWRRMIELGVVGEELNYRDFAATVNDAIGGREGASALNNVFTRFLSGAKGVAEKLYRYGDSFWKVYAYHNEMADYEKAYPDMPKEERERQVAEIVRDLNPTYSKVAEGVKNLRRLPFIAPFVSFQHEVVRTTKNTILQAFKELGAPETRGIGAKRLAGLVAAAAAPAALAAWLRSLNGVDDGEEKAIRRFLPEHQKESTLWFVGRDAAGRPKYIDGSRTDPHAYLTDAIMAVARAKSTSEGAANATSELAKPFIGEELLARPILDVARNKKEPGGEVYNPQDTAYEKGKAIAGRFGEAFAPGGYGPARRLLMGMTGRTEEKTGKGYDRGDAVTENISGQRIEDVDLERQLSNKARGFEGMRGEAAKITGEKIRAKGDVAQADLMAAAARTDEGRRKAFEDFGEDVRAAERLGLSRGRILRILHDSGVSSEDSYALLNGRTPKYMPKVEGTPQERQRAIAIRRGGR